MDKAQQFASLLDEVRKIVASSGAREQKLQDICQLLADEVLYYDWVGFYLVDLEGEQELVLGPFVGEPTEHDLIAFGDGICGQVADAQEMFVIQDVSQENNYLSCSPDVQSEIVVPLFNAEDELIGELDIDSHTKSPFTDEDRLFLDHVGELVGSLF